jgi:hypothetical protein
LALLPTGEAGGDAEFAGFGLLVLGDCESEVEAEGGFRVIV